MSHESQDQRRRRRGLWLVCALVVVLGAAASAVALTSGAPGGGGPRAATAGSGFGPASPPSSAQPPVNGNGRGDHGGGKGNGGVGTPAPVPAPVPRPVPDPAPAPGPSPAPPGHTHGQPPGKSLTATVRSVTQLSPGRSGSVVLRVENPNHQDVLMTGVASSVTSVTSGTRPGIPRCDKSWFVIGTMSGTPRVPGRGTTDVVLPLGMTNTKSVNQDNCKGVTYSFSFTVSGRQA